MTNLLKHERTQNGQGIIIVDAGGGTVDVSAYYMTVSPASFEEIAPTECMFFSADLSTMAEAE